MRHCMYFTLDHVGSLQKTFVLSHLVPQKSSHLGFRERGPSIAFRLLAVMITATATLHADGHKMNHIKEMIPVLKPISGSAALFVFVIGIFAAWISSHLPNMMVIPWLSDDMAGRPCEIGTWRKRVLLGGLTVVSVLGVVMARPVFLLLLLQAGISVVMPMALLGLIYLSARKDIQTEHRLKPIEWVALALIACFSLFMGYQGVQGLILDLVK